MDEDLIIILQKILDSADNTGCSPDLTVISAEAIYKLREYVKHYDIGSSGVNIPIVLNIPGCKRCDSILDADGFCTDVTCRYNDWNQEIPCIMLMQESTTLDIFHDCQAQGIPVRIRDEEKRASNDLFECVDCKDTFDIEDSSRLDAGLVCGSCYNPAVLY